MITGMLAATAIAIFAFPMLFVLVERLAATRGAAARRAARPRAMGA